MATLFIRARISGSLSRVVTGFRPVKVVTIQARVITETVEVILVGVILAAPKNIKDTLCISLKVKRSEINGK